MHAPDWGYESHTLAGSVRLFGYPLVLHVIINAYWEALDFELPPNHSEWRRCIDTYLDPPNDFCAWPEAAAVSGSSYRAEPRSVVILVAQFEIT